MYAIKCPSCKGKHTLKNGKRLGVQLYKCKDCGYQFRIDKQPSEEEMWQRYLEGKQTMDELATAFQVSPSTIKRKLRGVKLEWVQPPLSGAGFVHLDATYWGHNWGILLALDEETSIPLYMAFIKHETVNDYCEAIHSIEERGFTVRGIIIDGFKRLFSEFSSYRVQMCQFHMIMIVQRYLTKHPKLIAARELLDLVSRMTHMNRQGFCGEYQQWKDNWTETLNKRTILKSGKKQYTHKRLRSAMHSLDFYLPYLFTYQLQECEGMPNTNNKIEGTFTDLKKNLNNHSGMSMENRKRFICGFFLALKSKLERDVF